VDQGEILESHIENQTRFVEDVAVIQAFEDERSATRELVRSKDDVLVYHTEKEQIEIKPLFGFRDARTTARKTPDTG